MTMIEDKYTDLDIDDIGMTCTTRGHGALAIHWHSAAIGFGTLSIMRDHEGDVVIRNEHMTPEFCKALLCKLVDKYFKIP